MEGKYLTLKEVDNVKYLLSKGLKHQEIAEIMKIGKTTVSRIANGEHYLQRSANRERKLDSLLKELMRYERRITRKTRICVITEYSGGKTFEDAVANLFENGLMNGGYKIEEVESREKARRLCKSWFCLNLHEAEVKYIVTEKYDEEQGEWLVDYTEGIEILPCQ